MQLKKVTATVSVAPVGVPPTGLGIKAIHLSVNHRKSSDTFGETPKAADDDVRAPQAD